jgi:uncharacterized membrane protein
VAGPNKAVVAVAGIHIVEVVVLVAGMSLVWQLLVMGSPDQLVLTRHRSLLV